MGRLPHYRKSTIPEQAEKVFEGVIFDVYQWEQELYDGSTTLFEKVARPDTAVVIPVLNDNTILLIEDSQPHRETVTSTPSGRVEPGETPQETAVRELKEETGFQPRDIELLCAYFPEEKIDWSLYIFIGHGCEKVADAEPEAGERIVQKPVSFEEFITLIESGKYRGKEFNEYVLRERIIDPTLSKFRAQIFGKSG